MDFAGGLKERPYFSIPVGLLWEEQHSISVVRAAPDFKMGQNRIWGESSHLGTSQAGTGFLQVSEAPGRRLIKPGLHPQSGPAPCQCLSSSTSAPEGTAMIGSSSASS